MQFKSTWGSSLSTVVSHCMFSANKMDCTKMVKGRIKWELTEKVGKVCTVQVFGQEPLYPGKQCSPRATYHGKGIPCPGMAQDGIVPDMRIWVQSLLQRYRKQNRPLFSLTQRLASSNAVAFHNIPGSCCIVCPEVCTMACWEGTTVR